MKIFHQASARAGSILPEVSPPASSFSSRRPSARLTPGFTLVELTLSLSLMVLVLACAYACLSAGFSAQKVVEPRADVIQNGRVALALMTADLRCACTLPGGTDFLGMSRRIGDVQADNLDFATHNYVPSRPQESDFCELSYFVDVDPQTGRLCLWRRRNPIIGLDPLAGGRKEEIASGVRGLQFEYSDGFEWYESWGETERGQAKAAASARYKGNLAGMPEAVRITLLLDADKGRKTGNDEKAEPPPPMVFKTVARLNTARASSSSSTNSLNTGVSTPQMGPGQINPGGAP